MVLNFLGAVWLQELAESAISCKMLKFTVEINNDDSHHASSFEFLEFSYALPQLFWGKYLAPTLALTL